MNIFEEVKQLSFPDGQYIVVGSGIMAAKGIREAKDLDIIVTEGLFERCKSDGTWEVRPWTRDGEAGKEWLKRGEIDLHVELYREKGSLSAKDLLREAEIIDGIPFITLQRLTEFKKEYGRPKDFEDIKLIEEYLVKYE